MSKPLSLRAQRLVRAGKVLYGAHYQSALARAMGLSQTYVALLATGERPVTDDLQKILKSTLRAERKRLRTLSSELAGIIREINEEKHDE